MSESRRYALACLPGDGIGPEVIAETRKVIDAAASRHAFGVEWTDYPFGAGHYLKTGEILPDSAVDEMAGCDALLLGAVGDPRVRPGILERGILLHLRFHFDQYVNLRPARSYPRVPLPIRPRSGRELNTLVVRENTEDFYVGIGGRTVGGTANIDMSMERGLYSLRGTLQGTLSSGTGGAFQIGLASEPGIRRIVAYACRAARDRGGIVGPARDEFVWRRELVLIVGADHAAGGCRIDRLAMRAGHVEAGV